MIPSQGRWRILIFCAAFLLSSGTPAALAGPLVNGNFSAGLTGWTVSDPAYISAATGAAVFTEPLLITPVTLSQTFTIPQGTLTLSFVLSDLVTEPDNGGLPDGLAFSLLDPMTNASLVPVVPTTTNFYIRDLRDGVAMGEAATGVALTPNATALPLTLTVDVSTLVAAAALDVNLQFELLIGGPDIIASYTIDDVLLAGNGGGGGGGGGGTTGVPEPGTLLLIGVGFAGLWRRLRRGRAR